MNDANELAPLARKEGIIIRDLNGEVVLYDQNNHTAHCLNNNAAFVWKNCDGYTTLNELAARIAPSLSAPTQAATVVSQALDQLAAAQLLDGAMQVGAAGLNESELSRRDFLSRSAKVGLAAGAIVVFSMAVPNAVQAGVSCAPAGQTCPSPTGTGCCSGICSGGLCA